MSLFAIERGEVAANPDEVSDGLTDCPRSVVGPVSVAGM
jgi:hypothetical protein